MHDVDGLNAGYARLLLDEYLRDPMAVPDEWRALFEDERAAEKQSATVDFDSEGLDGGGLAPSDDSASEVGTPSSSPDSTTRALFDSNVHSEPADDVLEGVGARADDTALPPGGVAAPAEPSPEHGSSLRPDTAGGFADRPEDIAETAPAAATAHPEPEPPVQTIEPRHPPIANPDADTELLGAVAAAASLVRAFRSYGHLAARLDPLGSEPIGDPALDPERLEPSLTPELQARIPAALLRVHVKGDTLADALPRLERTYCGSMAYQIEHIADHEQRVWLRKAIESWKFRKPLSVDDRRRLYKRLCDAEGFERYLRRAFLGQKQFSLEGMDVLIPMLDMAIELAANQGAQEVVLGMAHRGRLNVLAHTIGMEYDQILREFEGERATEVVAGDAEGGSGDVKYHLGAEGTRDTPAGRVAVRLAANPSHLEAVDPVVEGMTRAAQTDRASVAGAADPSLALAILLHGDAAFAGQGVVAETLNLYALEGYSTGGTLHVLTNNQIGFTTEPAQGRSTRYSSDLAKGYDTPIIHVNGDDPEAALSAIKLGLAYRKRFGHDVVVDLVGYRRLGHNEQDEPSYTQPLMATQIGSHPTVRELYGKTLVAEGVLEAGEAEAIVEDVHARMKEAHEKLRKSFGWEVPARSQSEDVPREASIDVETRIGPKRVRRITKQLLRVPKNFTLNPKLEGQLARRYAALEDGGIDWGHAESLALGSLLLQGIPVRMSGQDTERGTFSHRHLVLHDTATGEIDIPMQRLDGTKASFEIFNSPLSEFACLGFEYGYSTAAPETLVLWEAQFGDFANGAQTIIDAFITSGLSKWRQTSRLTLLLPHGYEGNGPEHSSARVERFLQLAAQKNIRIANPTTSAQYFHLLRRQALDPVARPLVVMTPKGLLRHKPSLSNVSDFTDGTFNPVLDDESVDRSGVRRLVLCSGKIYYDIVGHEAVGATAGIAVGRIEELYPFPTDLVRDLIAGYDHLDEVVWAQEEPQNMGPWRSIRHRLEEAASGLPVRYVGRPWRASTAEGYPAAHTVEQERIVRSVLGEPEPADRDTSPVLPDRPPQG